jgi:D-glucosaminate-6-phosphate ammonia-lyase
MTEMQPGATAGTPLLRRIGVKPVINACGIYTDLGGSRLSPGVWAAMEEANRSFLRLTDLLEISGRHIAQLLGAEAARVTPGAAAAIMLGTAACMAGTDGAKSEQLPDTKGMKSEVLIQAGHRYKYDRQVGLAGAKLIEVGSANGTRADQFEQALGERTAMVIHPAHLDGKPGTIGLEQVAALAHKHGVPVFVDAAYMNYPTDLMAGYLKRGGDLVAISAKYFGGPNAGGFILGRKDLIPAVANVHFTRYESGKYLKFGRPLKMDRQTIVAVVAALEEWLAADHTARFANYVRQVDMLKAKLAGIPGLDLAPLCFTMDERLVRDPVNCLAIGFDKSVAGMSASEAADGLAAGDPSILAVVEGDRLAVVMDVLEDFEVLQIADRLRAMLKR